MREGRYARTGYMPDGNKLAKRSANRWFNAGGDAYFLVAASGTAGDEDVRIVNTNGTDAAAIALTASAGGIDVDAAGAIAITSTQNGANSVYLHADGGATETIKIDADQGTSVANGAASIQLLSDAGGIGIKSLMGNSSAIWISAPAVSGFPCVNSWLSLSLIHI